MHFPKISTYSQTCVQRPPQSSGRYSEVIYAKKFKVGTQKGGRNRQVDAIQRWSLTKV